MGKLPVKDNSDIWFLMELRDVTKASNKRDLSPFQLRPAYAYTKAEVGGHSLWHSEPTTN